MNDQSRSQGNPSRLNRHPSGATNTSARGDNRGSRWFPALLVFAAILAAPFLASAQSQPSDETLRAGADAYSAVCSACHQPGGAGLPGQFPPLIDNPNVQDTDYVLDVITNGLEGEIEVNGETYDGVMPAQSTLSDADTETIIAYIQSGFASPTTPAPEVATGPPAGTSLPPLADYTMYLAFLIALGAGIYLLSPRIFGVIDRRTVPWLDASLKAAIIVVGMILLTTIVPAKVLEFDTVQDLPRELQDLITMGLWAGGLAGGLWALWYAYRDRRI